MNKPSNVTQLLSDWRAGDEKAINKLMPLVQDNLHQIAANYMRGEQAGHTLQATALVNEAFMRLIDVQLTWQNRAHFIAIAARTMRRILVDHAKAKHRDKRGGDARKITLYETRIGTDTEPDILELEEVMTRLEQFDARKAQIIELSFYGGLTYEEIAEVLSISEATVDRELRFAKAWLYRELKDSTTRA
jgi:RNA polymerase sigma factor (TIGR02999 family)